MRVCFALLLLFVAQAYAIPSAFVRETNAQRIARGLPPLPPKLGKVLPGRDQSYKPTPAFAKRSAASASASPSASPSAAALTYIGRVQVTSEDGSPLGYVKSSLALDDSTPNDDLYVRVNANRVGGSTDLIGLVRLIPSVATKITAVVLRSSVPEPPAQGTWPADPQHSTLNLMPVRQTVPGGLPAISVDDTYSSAIWTMDLETKELRAKWINPDGSTPSTIMAYDSDRKTFFLTGDLEAYKEQHGANACGVTLHVTKD
ncbi:hypothetical protein OE88DRAFT_1643153 [Heliocybe sulcata]|uniref:Uncharacterized protein n=1 Tax=Heliocybe sulcata TaxID=5364 RepID=A0A5C3N7U3_9AGAM|nr:hypothetical protein OE88DRAFT_1643153 [Heliocybe sulcata]